MHVLSNVHAKCNFTVDTIDKDGNVIPGRKDPSTGKKGATMCGSQASQWRAAEKDDYLAEFPDLVFPPDWKPVDFSQAIWEGLKMTRRRFNEDTKLA